MFAVRHRRNTRSVIIGKGSVLTILVCLLLLGTNCGSPADSRKATEGAAKKLRNLPIVIDWTCFNARGITYDPPLADYTPVAHADQDGALVETLDALLGELRFKPPSTRMEQIHGYPCAIANTGQAPSNLDIVVSINVDNVSTWEAVKAVVGQMQCALLYGERMKFAVYYPAMGWPPAAFYGTRNISVHLEDVTAREALCAILMQSNVEIALVYRAFHDPKFGTDVHMSFLVIRFYEDGEPMCSKTQDELRTRPPGMPTSFTVECQNAGHSAEHKGDAKAPASGE